MSDTDGTMALYSSLTGLPEPHSQSEPMRITTRRKNLAAVPLITVVVPVFNKEKIIANILDNLVESMSLPFELIIIDDASEDSTRQIIRRFLQKRGNLEFVLVENNVSIYETACDNVGISLARGSYFLEVQSDILVKDRGFDQRLINALSHGNLGSVSGRACHTWNTLFPKNKRILSCFSHGFRPEQLLKKNLGVGLMGRSVFKEVDDYVLDDSYWISDTNNRGPWIVKMDTFKQVGILDSQKFFLGNDDHEFNFRCSLKGYKSGFLPVKIFTRAEDGSTRQKRTGQNQEIYSELKRHKTGEKELIQKLSRTASTTPYRRVMNQPAPLKPPSLNNFG